VGVRVDQFCVVALHVSIMIFVYLNCVVCTIVSNLYLRTKHRMDYAMFIDA
jgi:hypothetical protein